VISNPRKVQQRVQIEYATLETCATVTGSVVVLDVWRSFTTTAYALAAGVGDIVIAGTPEAAFELQQRYPGAVLIGMGALGGPAAEGFDYGNSPVELSKSDLHGRRVILCTPNGTPGLVRSMNAQILLAGSFVCAGATVRYLRQQAPARVTFVCTEAGIEDQACADYMAALLQGETTDQELMLGNIHAAGLQHARALVARGRLTEAQASKLAVDLDYCLALDRFDFVMLVQRRAGVLVMEAQAEPFELNA
jgi:2-phosphosulfolactate phosphatase